MAEPWRPRRVLSLDGGGIRGLSSIMILKAVMERINDHRMENGLTRQEPYEYFDMIGGTSTGGIIAVMLGRLHMTLDQCEQAYRELSKKIFTPKRSSWNLPGRANDRYQVNGKFDSDILERAIKSVIKEQLHPDAQSDDHGNLDDFMEQNPACNVFVTSAFRDIGNPVLLRTYQNRAMHDGISRELKIWQACRATSAATSFFDPFILHDGTAFVDSGIRWNNPVPQVLAEAGDMWPNDKDKIAVLSIGTSFNRHISLDGNLISVVESLAKIATDTELIAQDFYRDHRTDLVQQKRYIRLNVPELGKVGLEEFHKVSEIRQKTEYYLQENASERLHSCVEVLESSVITGLLETKEWKECKIALVNEMMSSRNHMEENVTPPAKDTLVWFLNQGNSQYQDWKESHEANVLWITAEAGCGKTVLAKFLTEQLKLLPHPSGRSCFFFFNSRNEKSRASNALCSMLHYLLESPLVDPRFFPLVLQEYKSIGSHIAQNVEVLYRLICKATDYLKPSAGRLPCVLDALDECQNPDMLTEKLCAPAGTGSSQPTDFPFKLIITIRHTGELPDWRFNPSHLTMDLGRRQESVATDIETVVRDNVNRLGIQNSEKGLLARSILERAGATFLWQALLFDEIKRLRTTSVGKISRLLENTPSGLNEHYEQILERRPEKHITLSILEIVIASSTPLSLDEINVALAVQRDNPDWNDTWETVHRNMEDSSNIEAFLKTHCGSFLRIGGAVVTLFHDTVRTFFETSSTMMIGLAAANRALAIRCISYLLLEDWQSTSIDCWLLYFRVRDENGMFRRLPLLKNHRQYLQTCFYDYSARHWFLHAQAARSDESSWALHNADDDSRLDELVSGVIALCDPSRHRLAVSIPLFFPGDDTLLFALKNDNLPLIFGILHHLTDSTVFGIEHYWIFKLAIRKRMMSVVEFLLGHDMSRDLVQWTISQAIGRQDQRIAQLVVNAVMKQKHEFAREVIDMGSLEFLPMLILAEGLDFEPGTANVISAIHHDDVELFDQGMEQYTRDHPDRVETICHAFSTAIVILSRDDCPRPRPDIVKYPVRYVLRTHLSREEQEPLDETLLMAERKAIESNLTLGKALVWAACGVRDDETSIFLKTACRQHDLTRNPETISSMTEMNESETSEDGKSWRIIIGLALQKMEESGASRRFDLRQQVECPDIALRNANSDGTLPAWLDAFPHVSRECIDRLSPLFDMQADVAVFALLILTNTYPEFTILKQLSKVGFEICWVPSKTAILDTTVTSGWDIIVRAFKAHLSQLSSYDFRSLALESSFQHRVLAHEDYPGSNVDVVLPYACTVNPVMAQEILVHAGKKLGYQHSQVSLQRALVSSIWSDNFELCESLLNFGSDGIVNVGVLEGQSVSEQKTPLMAAVDVCNLRIVHLLLNHHANPWDEVSVVYYQIEEPTPELLAIHYGASHHPEIDHVTGDETFAETDARQPKRTTSAISTATWTHEFFDEFLKVWKNAAKTFDVDIAGSETFSGKTVLHRIAQHGGLYQAMSLLGYTDVDASRQDRYGRTALHELVFNLHKAPPSSVGPLFELLVRHGADVLQEDQFGLSPLQYLCFSNIDGSRFDEYLEILISRDADYVSLEKLVSQGRLESLNRHSFYLPVDLEGNIALVRRFVDKHRNRGVLSQDTQDALSKEEIQRDSGKKKGQSHGEERARALIGSQ
ncbi:ankyrin repeat protein [Diplodia corticola]|uniref:phospholipase A2 n=1 Tax=Diplodia corticola TaxID=236234 RepID=A0A1J9RQ06_9PEZI|nr:ankyrin repeat protein [Diplodia corticola]OJD29637.1 ankyrin repeat protein [Diplodia corticola]